MSVVFVDVNIPMYAAGAEHPHKLPSVRFLQRIAKGELEVVTSSEIFQEILHRYRAIGRLEEGLAIYDDFRKIVPVVLPILIEDVDAARDILAASPEVGSRDALHAAVMQRAGVRQVASFDRGFDHVKSIRRIVPR